MKFFRRVTTGVVCALLLAVPLQVHADAVPGLVFREIEITGDEFVVLQNVGPGDIQHLSDYWLGYVSDDADVSTAPPVQQLPDVPLASGQALLLSGGGTIETCDAVFVAKLSPTLSNTGGKLALWLQSGGSFTQLTAPQANARWGKSTKSIALPAGEIDLTRETAQYTNPVWYFDTAAAQWQLGDFNDCTLTIYISPIDNTGTAAATWPQNTASPPVIVEQPSGGSASQGSSIPLSDQGLRAPQITELLPNPAGTGNDDTDEFIELYNPNAKAFDLTGFMLQTGAVAKHKFTFAGGTTLPPKSFTAFYSEDTGLSLSNSGGQAELFDPLGTSIAKTGIYTKAKDGLTWALGKGSWQWTTEATPNAENILAQANIPASGGNGSSTSTKSSSGSVKGSSTASNSSDNTSTVVAQNVGQITPVHPWTLALVAALALLYGAYEYRVDLANRLYRFRKYREARRNARS